MTDTNIEPRQPSASLLQKIDECADGFRTCINSSGALRNSVNEAYAQGEAEGFSKDDISSMIRKKILDSGFSDRTVRRYLPQELKRSGGYGHGSTGANGHLAIQTGHLNNVKAPVKQLAPDSINKTIIVQQPQPVPEPTETREQRMAAIEKKYGIDKDVDNSLQFPSAARDKRQHNEQIEQLQEENTQLTKQNKELTEKVQQLTEQNEGLSKDLDKIRTECINQIRENLALKTQLRKAGIEPELPQQSEAAAA